ncbi:hypothetical protein CVS40_1165 [Lucilia cuprina]|nr:hypothetical protein CVS40_1165 [Lucilia cuprina]
MAAATATNVTSSSASTTTTTSTSSSSLSPSTSSSTTATTSTTTNPSISHNNFHEICRSCGKTNAAELLYDLFQTTNSPFNTSSTTCYTHLNNSNTSCSTSKCSLSSKSSLSSLTFDSVAATAKATAKGQSNMDNILQEMQIWQLMNRSLDKGSCISAYLRQRYKLEDRRLLLALGGLNVAPDKDCNHTYISQHNITNFNGFATIINSYGKLKRVANIKIVKTTIIMSLLYRTYIEASFFLTHYYTEIFQYNKRLKGKFLMKKLISADNLTAANSFYNKPPTENGCTAAAHYFASACISDLKCKEKKQRVSFCLHFSEQNHPGLFFVVRD